MRHRICAAIVKMTINKSTMRQSEAAPWDNAGEQSDSNVECTLGHVEPTMGGVVTHCLLNIISLGEVTLTLHIIMHLLQMNLVLWPHLSSRHSLTLGSSLCHSVSTHCFSFLCLLLLSETFMQKGFIQPNFAVTGHSLASSPLPVCTLVNCVLTVKC